jgi:hypothetical protein
MNIKLAALPILTIVVSSTISLQSAHAGEPMSARFHFPANYYKMETNHLPQDNGYAPVPSAPASVPHDLLGIPQAMLQKAAVPQIAPMVQAKLKPSTFTQAVPINQPYKQTFGNPISPPQVAALPKTATPLALPALAKKLANANVPARHIVASRNVSANLLKPKRGLGSSAGPAMALGKKVESYGNVGYIPGFTTTSTGSSSSVSTNVAGTLLKQHSGR